MATSTQRKKQPQKEMVEKYYPIFKKKYEGKYFKYDNGYNREQRWTMYTKVVEIKPEHIYDTRGNEVTSCYNGWNFQTDTNGQITISCEKNGYAHSLQKEISEKEFNEAWNKMIEKINLIK